MSSSNNRYRFVRFRAEVTLRVPWDHAEHPGDVYERFRDSLLKQHADPEQSFGPNPMGARTGDVWDIDLTSRPRTLDA